MNGTIYNRLATHKDGVPLFGLLIDPENYTPDGVKCVAHGAASHGVDLILLGGSIVTRSMEEALASIRGVCNLPVVLFPGSPIQFVPGADALLFLSLISGRNAELLIASHVQVASAVKRSGIEVIPTGYILVDGGNVSSAQYVSNTQPIPSTKNDIAVATSIAGELLGQKAIYLEAGSGAKWPVPASMIADVRKSVGIPIIVGGGIRSPQQVREVRDAGASMVVVGNALENHLELLPSLVRACKES